MKKTILFIVLVFYIFSFSACKDDDWATYKNVNYELCTKIEGNIFLISEIGLATLYWTKLLRTRNYFNYSSYPADFKVFNPLYSTGVR